MPLTSALLVTLALAAAPERILLCRPAVQGDPALARAEAVVDAARRLPGRFLDYGVACESTGETARAAARAGLGHGIFASAEGQADGAHFLLLLTSAQEVELARRALLVAPGAEAAGPLREALRALERAAPRPPARWPVVTGWTLGGVGVAALATGAILGFQARGEARRAATAATPAGYQAARDAWRRDRARSVAALAGGGAALAMGLTLRLAF